MKYLDKYPKLWSLDRLTIASVIILLFAVNLFAGTERDRRQSVIRPSEIRAIISDPHGFIPDNPILQIRSPHDDRARLQKAMNTEINYLFQYWVSDDWMNHERELYEFLDQGLHAEITQLWVNNDWVNDDRYLYEYLMTGFPCSRISGMGRRYMGKYRSGSVHIQ
jgi:hypothetical protein